MASATRDNYMAIRKAELCHTVSGIRRVLKDTLCIFRDAVEHIAYVIMEYWDDISLFDDSRKREMYIESLIHRTKNNPFPEDPEFDRLFYKFPSYYRRAAIQTAYRQVASFVTRYEDWEKERKDAMAHGRKFRNRPPKLNLKTNVCPTLYKNNAYSMTGRTVRIKVRIRNTWDWIDLALPKRDYRDLMKTASAGRLKNPTLVFAYNKFYLHFPVRYRGTKFPKTKLRDQKILGVDLGINHGAVASLVTMDGTVQARAFDPFREDRGRLDELLQQIRAKAASSGKGQSLSKLYTKLKGVKGNYACQLAHWIVAKAEETGAYGIVLENLGRMKGRGRHKDQIHHWCKRRIMKLVRGMAFRKGIRVFIINPKNTSALAYDGSGEVVRDPDNHALCTFKSGKRYNCDLSASYNIAARYFIRQMQRELPADMWENLSAEVPEVLTRTKCTLSTLWKISGVSTAA